jgi:pimeloyl-ACP methyl ester carboxylesterase
MAQFEDRSWASRDGLRLHFRDYPCSGPNSGLGPDDRPPLLCLHGLTRNARDFEDLAARLSGQWRVICPDLRGRGDSDYARDPMTYKPAQYFEDIEALLEDQKITRFVAIGTSLGGLLTMMLAARAPERVAAAVLNDIGPEIDPAGLDRIREYVGQGRSHETWVHAARALQDTFQEAYPAYDLPDWLRMAKRVMVIGSGGRIVFDYDMNIAAPFEAAENAVPAPDMWPMFDALAGRPVLVLRGGLSDILSADTAARMAARGANIELVTLPDVGHAPTLDEPHSVAAIDRLLARVS